MHSFVSWAHRIVVVLAACAGLSFGQTPLRAELYEANWLAPVDGNWSEASKWDIGWSPQNGIYNNSSDNDAEYDVTIAAGGTATYTVTLNYGITINSLLINDPYAHFNLYLDDLTVTDTLHVQAGSMTLNSMFYGSLVIDPTAQVNVTSLTAGFAGDIDGKIVIQGENASLGIGNQTRLLNGAQIFIGDGSPEYLDKRLNISQDGLDVLSDGEIILQGLDSTEANLTVSNYANFTLGSNMVVRTGEGDGRISPYSYNSSLATCYIINQGLISAQGQGRSLYVVASANLANDFLINQGTMQAVDGGTLVLTNKWRNEGLIRIDDGIVQLGGTFTPDKMGTIDLIDGDLQITGTLDLDGGTLQYDPATLPFHLAPQGSFTGVMRNGRLEMLSPAAIVLPGSGGTLNNMTLSGTLIVPADTYLTTSLLTLDNAVIDMQGYVDEMTGDVLDASLVIGTCDNGPGNGTVIFNGQGLANRITIGNNTVNYWSGLVIENGTGDGHISLYASTFSNASIIHAHGSDRLIQITSRYGNSNLINDDILKVSDGATLDISELNLINNGQVVIDNGTLRLGAKLTTADLAGFSRSSGTFIFSGDLDNTGATLNLDSTLGPWIIDGGTIHNGALQLADSSMLQLAADGSVTFDSMALPSNLDLTIADGQELNLLGQWSNQGHITQTGGLTQLAGEFALSQIGNFTRTSGVVTLAGIFALESAAYDLDGALGMLKMRGGTLHNGSILASLGSTVNMIEDDSITFENVLFNADLDVADSAEVTIQSGFTLNGQIYLHTTPGASGLPTLNLIDAVLDGAGEVRLTGESYASSPVMNVTGTSWTFGSGMSLVSDQGGGRVNIDTDTFINDGNISVVGNGTRLSLTGNGSTALTNNGTFLADGGQLVLSGFTGNLGDAQVLNDGELSLDSNINIDQLLSIPAGCLLSLSGQWSAPGGITADHTRIEWASMPAGPSVFNFNDVTLGLISTVSAANLQNLPTGIQRVELNGSLELGTDTLDLAALPYQFVIDHSQINGGTISSTPAFPLQIAAGECTATGTTFNADVLIDSSARLISKASTFNNATISANGSGRLTLSDSSGQNTLLNHVVLETLTDIANGTVLVQNSLVLNNDLHIAELGNQQIGTHMLKFTGGSQSITGQGSIIFGSDTVPALSTYLYVMDGPLTIGPDIQLVNLNHIFAARIRAIGQTIINQGTWIATGNDREFSVYATHLSNEGSIELTQGAKMTLSQISTFANSGRLLLDNAIVTFSGATITNETTGLITGTGQINLTSPGGSLINQGTIAPGASPGTLTINGQLTQGATGRIEMDLADATQDLLNASTAVLDGTLIIALDDGFTPQLGRTFSIITATTLSGQFASIEGVAVNSNLSLAVTYSPTAVTVTAALPGDVNLDGIINLSDLQVLGDNWQSTTATWSMADFTGDGLVNLADLQVLGDHWNPAAGDFAVLAASIPEPQVLVMLVVLVGGAMIGRRRAAAA